MARAVDEVQVIPPCSPQKAFNADFRGDSLLLAKQASERVDMAQHQHVGRLEACVGNPLIVEGRLSYNNSL